MPTASSPRKIKRKTSTATKKKPTTQAPKRKPRASQRGAGADQDGAGWFSDARRAVLAPVRRLRRKAVNATESWVRQPTKKLTSKRTSSDAAWQPQIRRGTGLSRPASRGFSKFTSGTTRGPDASWAVVPAPRKRTGTNQRVMNMFAQPAPARPQRIPTHMLINDPFGSLVNLRSLERNKTRKPSKAASKKSSYSGNPFSTRNWA